jgi:hypothetical protein
VNSSGAAAAAKMTSVSVHSRRQGGKHCRQGLAMCCAGAHLIRCLSHCCRCGPPPPLHHPDPSRSRSGGPAARQPGRQTGRQTMHISWLAALVAWVGGPLTFCKPPTSWGTLHSAAWQPRTPPTSPSPPSPSSSSSPLEPISSELPPSSSSELSPDMPVPALAEREGAGGASGAGAGRSNGVSIAGMDGR